MESSKKKQKSELKTFSRLACLSLYKKLRFHFLTVSLTARKMKKIVLGKINKSKCDNVFRSDFRIFSNVRLTLFRSGDIAHVEPGKTFARAE